MAEQAPPVLFDRVFANGIAFLLPGLIVLAGVATVSPTVARWFGGDLSSPPAIGFLFVGLAAMAAAIVLTTIRWCLFEWMAWLPCREKAAPRGWRLRTVIPPGTPINEDRRMEHFAAYEDLRFQLYYHYLAYGNMAVGVPIALLLWTVASPMRPNTRWALAGVAAAGAAVTLVLGLAACEALRRYNDRRSRLLGVFQPQQPEPIPSPTTDGEAAAPVDLGA